MKHAPRLRVDGPRAVTLAHHNIHHKEAGEESRVIHVLLIDDNPADLELVQELLAAANVSQFTLTCVTTLKGALEQLAQRHFDLALVDLSEADAAAGDIKNRLLAANPTLSVIVLGNTEDEDPAIKIVRREMQDYLLKGSANGVMLGRVLRCAIEQRRAQQKLVYLGQHDSVTGLPNRKLFHDRLTQALERSRHTNKPMALLFLNLDRFKLINDSLGHESGDRLLESVAARLLSCIHSDDTIARLGGDEFLVVLDRISVAEHAARVAEKMLRALSAPIRIGDSEITVSTSIGIATSPRDGIDAETLVKNADAAMDRAKNKGRNNYQYYEPEMNACASERLALEGALRRALAQQEFRLHYQPIHNLRDGRVTGLEALIRWAHPQRGLMLPADFLPLMEESGLIVPAGEWVLRTACRQYRAWRARGLPPLRLKLNFSAQQLWRSDLALKIAAVLEEERVDPSCVVLELTEGTLMENTDSARQLLHTLRAMRLQISVDDFGTGYSSLGYLKRFPINSLKIDGSFVRDLPSDPDSAAIVCSIIDLAHHLRLRVIAEGVETSAQLQFLRQHGCDDAQGFYFSRPLAAEDVFAHCIGAPLPVLEFDPT